MTSGTEVRSAAAFLPQGIVEDVCFEVESGRIRSVKHERGELAQRRLGLLVPGMPNLHSHAFQRALVGRAEHRTIQDPSQSDSFWTWREEMYRIAQRLDEEALFSVASLLYVEMLEAGYTSVGEFHYLHHGPDGVAPPERGAYGRVLLEAAAEAGIRMTLLPVPYFTGGFDRPADPRQRRFLHRDAEDFLQLLTGLAQDVKRSGARLGVAPHSLRAVPLRILEDILDGAREVLGSSHPIHVHVSEQEAEVESCLKATGRRPVALLLERFEVGSSWCLVHATHVDAAERAALAASGAVVGLCPSTEANLGDGHFAFEAYLDEDGLFGVGSDSHVTVDPAEELRHLDYQARLRRRRRGVVARDGDPPRPGITLWGRAQTGGAQALGEKVSGLTPGALADWVELNLEHPRLAGLAPAAALDAFLLGSAPGAVRSVWVAGRPVVEDGRHPLRDAAERRFRSAMKQWTVEG